MRLPPREPSAQSPEEPRQAAEAVGEEDAADEAAAVALLESER
jgi:hypothetical protein